MLQSEKQQNPPEVEKSEFEFRSNSKTHGGQWQKKYALLSVKHPDQAKNHSNKPSQCSALYVLVSQLVDLNTPQSTLSAYVNVTLSSTNLSMITTFKNIFF